MSDVSFRLQVPLWTCSLTEARCPPIYQALRVVSDGFTSPRPSTSYSGSATAPGEGRVRCIAMSATDGMVRGMKTYRSGWADFLFPLVRDAGSRDECHRASRSINWPNRAYQDDADSPPGATL